MREINLYKILDNKDWKYGIDLIKDKKRYAEHNFINLKEAKEFMNFLEETYKKYEFEYKVNLEVNLEIE